MWLPHAGLQVPNPSPDDLLQASLQNISAAIKQCIKQTPSPIHVSPTKREIILKLKNIFTPPTPTEQTLQTTPSQEHIYHWARNKLMWFQSFLVCA